MGSRIQDASRRRALALIAGGVGLPGIALQPALAQKSDLIGRMTLAEKLGQLTILSAGFTVTGPEVPVDVAEDVRTGRVGSLFNLWGRDAVRAAQRAAVEETRLGIPLFFALRRHPRLSHRLPDRRWPKPAPSTPRSGAPTAAAAAEEAAAAGLDLTFAPMLDIARDPRWGRIVEGPGEDPVRRGPFRRGEGRRLPGCRTLPASPRRPSTTSPTAPARPAATTPRSTSPSARSPRSICRRSARRWRPARSRSCRPSPTSPACR